MSKIKPKYNRNENGLWLPEYGIKGPNRFRPESERYMAGYPCCCGVPCDYCAGNVPGEIMVKLESVADGATPCSTSPVCAALLNNWFILPKTADCTYTLIDDWTCEDCDTYMGRTCPTGWRTYYVLTAWWKNNYYTWGGTNVGYALAVSVHIALCWCSTSDTEMLKAQYYHAYGATKPSCLLASEITLTRDIAATSPCNFSSSVCKAKAA